MSKTGPDAGSRRGSTDLVQGDPLPDAVLEAINAHMTAYPPIEVTLPWDRTDGKPTSFSLLLYSREKKAPGRNYINTFIWKPALKRAGVPATRRTAATPCGISRQYSAP